VADEVTIDRPEGITTKFDASLKEILHLVGKGYGQLWPEAFSYRDSKLTKAMDKARRGHFELVPDFQSENAIYFNDDTACEYDC